MIKNILFMDNIQKSLDVQSRILEKEGYVVLRANSIEKAENLLREKNIHLAVLDIRMRDEDDPADISGLLLASKEEFRFIPKIILTGYPSYEYVREALGPSFNGLPPAVDFLSKGEEPNALLEAVSRAFHQHIRVNWDLLIQTNERYPVPFAYLASLLEPGAEREQFLENVEEIEDLFRRLFYEDQQIRIERLLWHRRQRIALLVFAFTKGKKPEAKVVICGSKVAVIEERQAFQNFVPNVLSNSGSVLVGQSETLHLAANAYTLANSGLGKVHSLIETYHLEPDRIFNATLHSLFETTLSEWQTGKPIPDDRNTIEDLYRQRLGLTSGGVLQFEFEKRLYSIVHQCLGIGEKIDYARGRLNVRFGGQEFSYPDPVVIFHQALDFRQPALVMKTPGVLTGDNILAEVNGTTWLTDFADAGLAPQLWNFVAVEAAIRFDWLRSIKLQVLHEMETVLVKGDFNRLDLSDLDQSLRKPVRAIQIVRRMAAQAVGNDPMAYHLGMLFQAVSRLISFNPEIQLVAEEITRLAHILIASAMICEKIELSKNSLPTFKAMESGIKIDKINRMVSIDGVRVTLRGQTYNLLLGLYERAGRLCTRREIIEQILGQKYDETDSSQISRLNTAIRRLREKIEYDPDHPRYLLTETGGGYRLRTSANS
jgi:DNA-binding response OmpR family regulator